jgi:hypothetical protein
MDLGMYYTIYKITNQLNGKCYVGKHQTNNLNDGYMGSGKLIKRAIAKYGIENFSKEMLYVFQTEDEMNEKEAEIVTEEFCKTSYNLCKGGQGGFGFINRNGLNLKGQPNPQNFKYGIDKKLRMIEKGTWVRHQMKLKTLMKNAAKKRKSMRGSDNHNSKRVVDETGKEFESLIALSLYHNIHKDTAGRRLKRGMYKGTACTCNAGLIGALPISSTKFEER